MISGCPPEPSKHGLVKKVQAGNIHRGPEKAKLVKVNQVPQSTGHQLHQISVGKRRHLFHASIRCCCNLVLGTSFPVQPRTSVLVEITKVGIYSHDETKMLSTSEFDPKTSTVISFRPLLGRSWDSSRTCRCRSRNTQPSRPRMLCSYQPSISAQRAQESPQTDAVCARARI